MARGRLYFLGQLADAHAGPKIGKDADEEVFQRGRQLRRLRLLSRLRRRDGIPCSGRFAITLRQKRAGLELICSLRTALSWMRKTSLWPSCHTSTTVLLRTNDESNDDVDDGEDDGEDDDEDDDDNGGDKDNVDKNGGTTIHGSGSMGNGGEGAGQADKDGGEGVGQADKDIEGQVSPAMQPLILHALQILRNEQGDCSWHDFDPAIKGIISKTITLNLGRDREVLDKTLYRGTELLRTGSDPRHVLRRFTALLPNALGVSQVTLDSDIAAMKAIFKASGGSKAVVGG
ncbi:unnamed protein product, partial [Laminaria digitata]